MKIPKELLNSEYRREMWRNATKIMDKISKVIPIKAAYLTGSFTTKKRRPSDADFIVLLKTGSQKGEMWSFDMVIAPDNKYGATIVKDAKKWVKQRYGKNKSAFLKVK